MPRGTPGKQRAAEAHVVQAERDASNWVDGRLAREFALQDAADGASQARAAQNEARQAAMGAIKAVVEDGSMSVEERVKRLQEMSASGDFNPIGGAHQSHLVLAEAIKKISDVSQSR